MLDFLILVGEQDAMAKLRMFASYCISLLFEIRAFYYENGWLIIENRGYLATPVTFLLNPDCR